MAAPLSATDFLRLHGSQLDAIGFPHSLLPTLQCKLQGEGVFDAGSAFQIVEDEEGQRQVMATRALAAHGDVFLIDHAFSFAVERYRRDLQEHPELLARLAAMMGLRGPTDGDQHDAGVEQEDDDGTEEALVMARPAAHKALYEQVCEQIWRYAAHYRLADPRDPQGNFRTVWYVMDEFGSAFRHSSHANANVRVAVFVHLPEGKLSSAVAYSLAWPVAAVVEGEECRRDFALGLEAGSLQRAVRLSQWFRPPASVRRRMREAHVAKFAELRRIEQEAAAASNSSSSSSSSSSSTSVLGPHPSLEKHFSRTLRALGRPIRIYCDNAQVVDNLTRPEFEHVASAAEADVVWLYHTTMTASYRAEQGLGPDVVLNQAVGDECLVFKHLLPLTAARAPGWRAWLPLAFDMEKEAAAFVHELFENPRLFILKPWNLGRSMDTAVADSLAQALAMAQTCPKVACEYVSDPALVHGKKIDVRYRLMVRSWRPLELIRWTHWGLRVSNKAYSLEPSGLNDFERHLTVMSYAGYGQNVVEEAEFMAAFERENGVPFAVVDARAERVIKAIFEAAVPLMVDAAAAGAGAEGGGEEGAAALQRVACFYGVDMMFTKEGHEPKLLEVTFGPDCAAAVKDNPDFYNDAFGVLFLNEEHSDFRMLDMMVTAGWRRDTEK